MSDSGKYVNYNLRTSKSVERRMILITAKELFKDIDISKCRYIGMGSTYFTDFKLFHRELHIENMISIEIEKKIIERVEYNKPYKCIDIKPGKSTDVLPTLDWRPDTKDFIWMDYDDTFDYDVFNDIEHIFSNIQQGSIYLMSCNKQLKDEDLTSFKEKFGELVPNDIKTTDFSGENDFSLIGKMLKNKIEDVIIGRNHKLDVDKKLEFKQLFFFTYKDNAPMISYGGYLDFQTNGHLNKYRLDFEFIKKGSERCHINPPNISYKETTLLNTYLPNTETDYINEASIKFIPEGDRRKYRELYKYLPNYMDVIY